VGVHKKFGQFIKPTLIKPMEQEKKEKHSPQSL
jgi:hypothetical protein